MPRAAPAATIGSNMIPALGVPVWKNTTESAPSGPLRSISILRPPTSRVSAHYPLAK